MKIEIPQSLFDRLVEVNHKDKKIATMTGPFGTYEIVAIPDVDYTEIKTVTRVVYKD